MRRLAIWIITLSFLYFVIGYIFVLLDFWDRETYNQVATIIGGTASILGLLGFILPGIKTTDLKALELDTLKNLAVTAEEIQKRDRELTTKQSDIVKLELQKKELEFLVRKASLSLFFKEQLERYYQRLVELISDNKEISRTINEITELKEKISELDVEIEKNPNAEKVLELVESAKRERLTTKIRTPLDFLFDPYFQLFRLLTRRK